MTTFEIGAHDFLLDGRPHQIISGALHYFRVHPDLWADRIHKARLMGLNAIETVVPWNFHVPEVGAYDFTGQRDIGRFLDLIHAEGMHAIVRPSPYICGEWDGGGFPGWLFADSQTGVRRAEPRFLEAIEGYLAHLLPHIAERQVTRGGAVIAVQVENEYGAYPDVPLEERTHYLRALVEMTRAQGIDVPLLTCDQANDEMLSTGGLPELHKTANFGANPVERLEILRRHQSSGPLMCMEFWDGWFDSWGEIHHITPSEQNAQDLDIMLGAGASVNIYMFHGGTNMGLTNGANDKGVYKSITTSYDYDAPLSEDGSPTDKYFAFREVIARYAPVPDEVPEASPDAPTLEVTLDRAVRFTEALPALGSPGSFDHTPTMDELRQWTGFALYRTPLEANDAVLSVEEVRDRAIVMLDGEPIGLLDRATSTTAVALPARAGELGVLLEDQGRVNYGPRIGEQKGLIGKVRTATRDLDTWTVTPLRIPEAPHVLADHIWKGRTETSSRPFAGPVFRAGRFDSVAGRDHFLRLDGWTKGLAWVNGELLGRYWSFGPTETMFIPGPLIRESGNELVLFELHGASTSTARFVSAADLGPTEP
ncbi:beta-galactosidase family protein [Microbacterium sp. NPDC087589]|uniref:glycoside hydrolase family 35 protein n=1 Tax=Microbacterium sp. NPDC087589 TaxID=3364191 RepID=UPI0037F614C8